MVSLGDKLISLRKESKLTQAKVAERLNVSRQAISRWESGAAMPSTDNLAGLSELYNVSVDYLLNKDNSEQQLEEAQGEKSQPKSNRLWKFMPPKTIAFILVIVLVITAFAIVICNPNYDEKDEVTPIEEINQDKWDDTGTEVFTFD